MTAPASAKLERLIQTGLIILVAVMPFHAFLSVWLGHLTGYQTIIQAWKEILLVLLSSLAIFLIIHEPHIRRRLLKPPVLLAAGFATVAALVTLVTQPSLTAIAFGAKTDLEFLVAFILAVLVTNRAFVTQLVKVLLISASIVVGFGLLQSTVLPADFLVSFGYGPATVPPYLVLDPAVQSLRFASTLGGPNQLGTYLMLPLALAGVIAFRQRKWWLLALVATGSYVMVHTYSRSAWIGGLVAAIIITLILTPRRSRAGMTALIALLGLAIAIITTRLLKRGGDLQYYLLHSSQLWHGARGSDYEHLNSLREGVNLSLSAPLGHGLGTAGPATFHTGTGLIIENNYLQIAYETGLFGAFVFVAFLGSVGLTLARRAAKHDLAAATLAALAGVCTTALVLPAWTDSTTALTLWTAAGSLIGLRLAEDTNV